MSGSALVVLLALVLGWPLARLTGAESSRSGRAGLAILLGFGTIGLALFILSLAGISWSRPSLLGAFAVVGLGALAVSIRKQRTLEPDLPPPSPGSIAFLAITAVIVAGHGLFALTGPNFEADFLEIWGLKGRAFYEARAVDWDFLQNETTYHNHPDYPPLVPLLFAAAGILGGGWEDGLLGSLYSGFGVALLLITEATMRRRFGETWLVGAAVLVLAPLALTPWPELADGPLLAFGSAALLYLWRGVRSGSLPAIGTGAVLLGFAALTKNEGVAMIVAALLALAVTPEARRYVVRLWPAAVLALVWIVPQEIARLNVDLAAGNELERLFGRLADPLPIIELLLVYTPERLTFWGGIVLGAAVTARRLWRSERILVAFVVFQILAYFAAYGVSPHDLAWHIRWSWERLASHVAFLATAAVLMAVIPSVARDQGR
ncbi:MAG: glycosyltransferase family 39 protein, partial [Thermoanaerobaculia bacterium]